MASTPVTGNVMLEPLGGGLTREETFNGQAVETVNARLNILGPFREDNPAASQAATALQLGAIDGTAPTGLPAPAAGTIVGIISHSNAALTAGTATAQATVNGTASGDTSVLSTTNPTKKVTMLTTPVAFVQGDLLGIKLATSSGYLPVTADHDHYLMVRWGA